jgi:hypothetical protein
MTFVDRLRMLNRTACSGSLAIRCRIERNARDAHAFHPGIGQGYGAWCGDGRIRRMIGRIRQSPAIFSIALILCTFLLTSAAIMISMHPIHLFGEPSSARQAAALLPGFTADDAPSPGIGLIVTSLRSGSEAQRAGLRVGDAVLSVDGRAIRSLGQIGPYLRRDRNPRIDFAVLHGDALRHVILMRGQDGVHGT